MSVEVRKVDEAVYDGTTGQEVDTITRYELGAEIDGAWVKFASVSEEHVNAKVAAAKQQQQSQQPQSQQQQGDTGAPQAPTVPTVADGGQQTPTQDQSSQPGQ